MSGDLRVLTAIDFVGNDSLGADELKGQIVTSETTGTFSKDVRYYDPAVFAVDQKRIIRWYNGRGFYRAGVEKVEEIQDAEGRVKLAVHVREGPRAIVRRVDFDGAGDLSAKEIQRLSDAIALPAGEPFDEDRYEKSKLQLVAELREGGFARAEAGGRVRVDAETGDTAITYTLRTGDRFRLGEVTIEGNEAVPTAKIARAAAIEAGAPFKPSALQLAQKRIYRLGVFSGVRILAEPVDADGEAPVTVRVREAPFHTVRYGGGLALDAFRWQVPIVRAEYTDRNLADRLLRLDLKSQVGFAWVPDIASVAAGATGSKTGITTQDTAEIQVPGFLQDVDLGFRTGFARDVQSGYAYNEVSARVSLGWTEGPHSIVPSMNVVHYFNGTADTDAQSLINQGNENVAALLNGNCIPSCTLAYPELRYTFDLRDDPVMPRSGFFATIGLQQTIPGTFAYFRVEPDVRGYVPLSRSLVLAARVKYGALLLEGKDESSPLQQRFFGGGQNDIRGYAARQQGPKAGGIVDDGRFTTWLATGGNGEFLLSGEVRWLTDFWFEHSGVVFFVDVSRITVDSHVPWEGGPLEIAPGIGIRYITPVGSFRFDVAYVVNPTVQTMPSVTAKASDGSTIVVPDTLVAPACSEYPNQPCLLQRRWGFHVSIGEAF